MIYDFSDIKQFPSPPPGFEAPIADHVAYLSNYIYDKPYFDYWKGPQKRLFHGKNHVTSAMILGTVCMNSIRQLGQCGKYTDRQLKLIQIALLLHDSGREGDGEDLWDGDSAINVCNYLIACGATEEEARFAAHAMRNKDAWQSKKYYSLKRDNKQKLIWEEGPFELTSLSEEMIISMLSIQFGDCLEIIRARPSFDRKYLVYYHEVAQKYPAAADWLPYIIMETRRFINDRGENYWISHKSRQESNSLSYDQLIELLHEHCPLLAQLFNNAQLDSAKPSPNIWIPTPPSFDSAAGLNDNNLLAAMEAGQIGVRAIQTPSIIHKLKKNQQETQAELELRKVLRVKGNPDRSISTIGWGAPTFGLSGFLFFGFDYSRMKKASSLDCNTGMGKKPQYFNTQETMQQEHLQLVEELKTGSGSALQNEVIYDVQGLDINAIFFTPDPTYFKHELTVSNLSPPPYSKTGALEALYLQGLVRARTGQLLPLVEYSAQRHTIHLASFDEAAILKIWHDIIAAELIRRDQKIQQGKCQKTEEIEREFLVDSLLFTAPYKDSEAFSGEQFYPLIHFYSHALREKLFQQTHGLIESFFKEKLSKINCQQHALLLQDASLCNHIALGEIDPKSLSSVLQIMRSTQFEHERISSNFLQGWFYRKSEKKESKPYEEIQNESLNKLTALFNFCRLLTNLQLNNSELVDRAKKEFRYHLKTCTCYFTAIPYFAGIAKFLRMESELSQALLNHQTNYINDHLRPICGKFEHGFGRYDAYGVLEHMKTISGVLQDNSFTDPGYFSSSTEQLWTFANTAIHSRKNYGDACEFIWILCSFLNNINKLDAQWKAKITAFVHQHFIKRENEIVVFSQSLSLLQQRRLIAVYAQCGQQVAASNLLTRHAEHIKPSYAGCILLNGENASIIDLFLEIDVKPAPRFLEIFIASLLHLEADRHNPPPLEALNKCYKKIETLFTPTYPISHIQQQFAAALEAHYEFDAILSSKLLPEMQGQKFHQLFTFFDETLQQSYSARLVATYNTLKSTHQDKISTPAEIQAKLTSLSTSSATLNKASASSSNKENVPATVPQDERPSKTLDSTSPFLSSKARMMNLQRLILTPNSKQKGHSTKLAGPTVSASPLPQGSSIPGCKR